MYQISENTVKSILKNHFSSLVGRSCKRIEVIRDQKDIPEETKFNLLRDLIKELNYETMRDIVSQIASFSEGVNISINLQRPDSKKE